MALSSLRSSGVSGKADVHGGPHPAADGDAEPVAAQDPLKPSAVKTELGEDLEPERGPLRGIPTRTGLRG
jgi:hypothetical protein